MCAFSAFLKVPGLARHLDKTRQSGRGARLPQEKHYRHCIVGHLFALNSVYIRKPVLFDQMAQPQALQAAIDGAAIDIGAPGRRRDIAIAGHDQGAKRCGFVLSGGWRQLA
tara:strand:+ start:3998 stop:4330 length:333 start_codon:yes stop_codon:yes gene_type:complete